MISFDGIVCVSLHDMERRQQQLIEHTWIGRRAIGVHLCGAGAVVEGAGKESASGRQISLVGYQNIDDLAILVDCPIQIPPARRLSRTFHPHTSDLLRHADTAWPHRSAAE